ARNGSLFVSELIARENGTAIFVDGNAAGPSSASIDHALMEKNANGLLVDNATVAIRNSVAAENSAKGIFERASTSGMTAEVYADHCQATRDFDGFFAGSALGTVRMAVSNSVSSSNTNIGIAVSEGGTVRA